MVLKKYMSIVMISSEMPEVLGMSDRILVMYNGSITGEFDGDEATQEKIMKCAVGIKMLLKNNQTPLIIPLSWIEAGLLFILFEFILLLTQLLELGNVYGCHHEFL